MLRKLILLDALHSYETLILYENFVLTKIRGLRIDGENGRRNKYYEFDFN